MDELLYFVWVLDYEALFCWYDKDLGFWNNSFFCNLNGINGKVSIGLLEKRD